MTDDEVRIAALEHYVVRLAVLVPPSWMDQEIANLQGPDGLAKVDPARLRAAALIAAGRELRSKREASQAAAPTPQSTPDQVEVGKRNALLLDRYEREVGVAKSYATVVVGAGYAGLLAMWSGLRDHIDRGLLLASAILIILSVCMFVIWEVIKVAMTNAADAKFNQVVALKFWQPDFDTAVGAVRAEAAADAARLNKFQPVSFWFSLCTGFVGAAILIYACIIAATGLRVSFGS